MKVKTIFYNMQNLPQTKKTLIKRKLFGYIDHSNRGFYRYEREGLLKEIPHFRPTKATIITKPNDHKKVIDLLEKYGVDYLVIDSNIQANLLKKS